MRQSRGPRVSKSQVHSLVLRVSKSASSRVILEPRTPGPGNQLGVQKEDRGQCPRSSPRERSPGSATTCRRDARPRAGAATCPRGLPLLRLHAHRHAGLRSRSTSCSARAATSPTSSSTACRCQRRQGGDGPAVRPDGAVRPLRGPVHQPARHAVQALRDGPGLARRAPGQGRYREFWQCDFDTIGTTSNAADIETALVINDLFTRPRLRAVRVRINNRLVLNGLLGTSGLADKAVPLLRSLDKLPKIGREKVAEEMVKEAGVTAEQAGRGARPRRDDRHERARSSTRLEAFFAGAERRRRPRASAACANCSRWRRPRASPRAASRST